jgi:hypothetical protein
MAKEIENKKILEFYSFAFFVIGTSQQCWPEIRDLFTAHQMCILEFKINVFLQNINIIFKV